MSHKSVYTLFLLFSQLLEHIQRNFWPLFNIPGNLLHYSHLNFEIWFWISLDNWGQSWHPSFRNWHFAIQSQKKYFGVANFQGCWKKVRSSSVRASEPKKMTKKKTKCIQCFGTPCILLLVQCYSAASSPLTLHYPGHEAATCTGTRPLQQGTLWYKGIDKNLVLNIYYVLLLDSILRMTSMLQSRWRGRARRS